jgi:hypothetical protein
MEETRIKELRKINHPIYDYFYNGSKEINSTLENLKKILDESSKNYISSIEESLLKLTFTEEGSIDLNSKRNIKIIIGVNIILRELALKRLCSEDFIERWYMFIEMYYYSYAIHVKAKCIQYKDNNNDEVKEKRAYYIGNAKLFIDLHSSLANVRFGLEEGYRSYEICGELKKLCQDL